MISENYKVRLAVTACIVAFTSFNNLAAAQSADTSRDPVAQSTPNTPAGRREAAAIKHVNDAVAVVRTIEAEPHMKELLQQARGVFIVPNYGRAALGVGANGGPGVLLAKRNDGTWSDPVFYDMGGINVGVQAGVEGGPIVMVLNNDKALNKFMQKNNFSLSADAGLTVINWTAKAQGSAGTGDVIVWSGNKGLFGNVVTVGINDVRFNRNLTNDYYHRNVALKDVINGAVQNPQADTLRQALASVSGPTSSGSSGGGTGKSGATSE